MNDRKSSEDRRENENSQTSSGSALPVTRRSVMKGASVLGLGGALLTSSSGVSTETVSAHETDGHAAETPPMGWNSWNAFGKDVSQELIMEIADFIVESGMKDAGYEYVVVDGGWRASTRDDNGDMQPNEKFPDMAALGDYIHNQGLKFGLHQPGGMTDCAGTTPGTQSAPGDTYAEKAWNDAQTLTEWGIDYIKFDLCGIEYPEGASEHRKNEIIRNVKTSMGEALDRTERSVTYSINTGGHHSDKSRIGVWYWAPDAGVNLWRTTGDIKAVWDDLSDGEDDWWNGVVNIIDKNADLFPFAKPGHWNDPDMLEVGVDVPDFPGLSETEDRSHFGMWAMMAAPLMAAADLRNLSETTQEILTNEEVIAVDQDPAGNQGWKVRDDGDQEVWTKPLANGDHAVALFNRGGETAEISTTAWEIGAVEGPEYSLRDLWSHETSSTSGEISASVPSHGVTMYRVQSVGGTPGSGENNGANGDSNTAAGGNGKAKMSDEDSSGEGGNGR